MDLLSKTRPSSKASRSEAVNPWDETIINGPPLESLRKGRERLEPPALLDPLGAPTEDEEEAWRALGRS